MPTHEFSTFSSFGFFYFCLLGAKRLAFNGAVDWVTGPLAPVLFIGPLLFFLAPFFTTSFHFSTFSFPEGRSTEQTNKRRFAGYDPHMNFSHRRLAFSILPAALAGTPPVREREREGSTCPIFSSGQRERETKTFWTTRREKKGGISIFFFGMGQEGFVRAKRKLGDNTGKSREISFSFEKVYLFGFICSPFPFPHFIVFSSTAPREGKKHTHQQTPQPTTGKRLGCREGWIGNQ